MCVSFSFTKSKFLMAVEIVVKCCICLLCTYPDKNNYCKRFTMRNRDRARISEMLEKRNLRHWGQPISVSVFVMISSSCFSIFVLITINIFSWKIEIVWAYRRPYCIKQIWTLLGIYAISFLGGTEIGWELVWNGVFRRNNL